MRKLRVLAAMASSVVVAGCTTSLKSTPSDVGKILVGQAYNLPRAEFFVGLDRELKECSVSLPRQELLEAWVISEAQLARDGAESVISSWLSENLHPERAANTKKFAGDLGVNSADLEALSAYADPIDQKLLAQQVAFLLVSDQYELDPSFQDSAGKKELKQVLADKVGTDPERAPWLSTLTASVQKLKPSYSLVVDLRAKVDRQLLPDPKQYYALNYATMGSGFKKTEYHVEKYPNGTLKSINSIIDDQSASVVNSVANGVLTLAAAATGIPTGTLPHAGEKVFKLKSFKAYEADKAPPLCRPELMQVIELRKAAADTAAKAATAAATQNPVIDALSAEATKAAADWEAKKKARQALPAGDAGIAAADTAADKAKTASEDAAQKLTAAKQVKDNLQQTFLKADAQAQALAGKLILSVQAQLTPTGTGAIDTLVIPGARSAADQWFEAGGLAIFCSGEQAQKNCTEDEQPLPVKLNAVAQLIGAAMPTVERAIVEDDQSKNGVAYREPGRAILKICGVGPCLSETAVGLNGAAFDLLTQVVDVPQYGVIAVLPLYNGSFQNNTLTARFTELGSVSGVDYTSNARFAEMAKSFEGTAQKYKTYRDGRRDQTTGDIEAQIKELEARKRLSEAQKALADAEAERLKATTPTAGESGDAQK